ncbi:Flp family type IVb pilin [Microvirga sp. KLBC 81]|uniref:Flp family type IVb pilin n=1 Tax=Microvirga sp. KLBC 81 TaxID=1862707 RepID=UPI000D506040|nr:Flp family type IVb pilin [Microvirga sp. KLBC 81]PVE25662.1 Flp family type IVb pilin [Microvirga sp. KLBC 81]
MTKFIKGFVRNEDGATMVEYGLLVGLISIAALATLILLGPELNDMFNRVLVALQAL